MLYGCVKIRYGLCLFSTGNPTIYCKHLNQGLFFLGVPHFCNDLDPKICCTNSSAPNTLVSEHVLSIPWGFIPFQQLVVV